jgi:hypothetical protein
MRRGRMQSLLGLVLSSALLAGLAAAAFGLLCKALYWILSGGDAEGNPFGALGFALAGTVAGAVMGFFRVVDRLGDWPEPETGWDRWASIGKGGAKTAYAEESWAVLLPLTPAKNGKTWTSRKK